MDLVLDLLYNDQMPIQVHKDTLFFNSRQELLLNSGETLSSFDIAYETYGTLNESKTNAILICHALSADAHSGNGGWWNDLIGPGKVLDTTHYYVISSNVLGSCYGSSGPSSQNPETDQPYGLKFPMVTICDMVKAQKLLIDHLGIDILQMVIGGSMGGMQALEWVALFPDRVRSCVPIASTSKLSTQALAFGAVGRNAIISDSNWNKGDYYGRDIPEKGLSIARMIGHITYLSEESMIQKFGRKLQSKEDYGYNLQTDFQVESYLHYQGSKFVSRFDANSYLYLSKAMSYFDLHKSYGSLENAFSKTKARFLVMAISSDWLYATKESKKMVKVLMKLNKEVTYCEIESPYGHDGFLLSQIQFGNVIGPFLEALSGENADA